MRYTVRYDVETDRWHAEDPSGERYAMHCGETFLIRIGKEFVRAHLELDSDWYVKVEGLKFWLHWNETYTIEYFF